MTRWLTMALVALLAAACSKDEAATDSDEAAETEIETETEVATAGEDAAPAANDDDDVPTAEDFEEEAEGSISADNLEAEVEALEAELGDDDDLD